MRPYEQAIVDGENSPIGVDVAYVVQSNDDIVALITQIANQHNAPIGLLPLSGMSGGGGVFQVESPENLTVVGLVFSPTNAPKVRLGKVDDITQVSLDEVVINQETMQVFAGASITLEQLNSVLAQQCGAQFKVLGADLTSYTYAAVGATFMTGGMGPQRRYFSHSVTEISLFDGKMPKVVSGDKLAIIAGTYGWGGITTAVCCRYVELPTNEIAFAIPVLNTPERIAALLVHLLPFCHLQFNGTKVSSQKNSDLVLGIEHVTVASMQPLLTQVSTNEVTQRAEELIKKCTAAGADGLVFINGYSHRTMDDFFGCLVDNLESAPLTIAGIDLAYTEVFNDPKQMRALREAIPYAARTQQVAGRYTYKGHTDGNIQINPDCAEQAIRAFWKLNQQYVGKVQHYFDTSIEITGEILVYGHLNPVGIDPHNRITFSCDSQSSYQQAVQELEAYRSDFYRELNLLCKRTDSLFIGGEKGAGSEREILEAFVDRPAPKLIARKFQQQAAFIKKADPMFSWRAMAPYNA